MGGGEPRPAGSCPVSPAAPPGGRAPQVALPGPPACAPGSQGVSTASEIRAATRSSERSRAAGPDAPHILYPPTPAAGVSERPWVHTARPWPGSGSLGREPQNWESLAPCVGRSLCFLWCLRASPLCVCLHVSWNRGTRACIAGLTVLVCFFQDEILVQEMLEPNKSSFLETQRLPPTSTKTPTKRKKARIKINYQTDTKTMQHEDQVSGRKENELFFNEEDQEILYQIKSLAALEKITESLQKALGKGNWGPPGDR
uniref:Uncharacterized protein n=1 Tax=Phocoena sinus TaxID=42100 RepID=A0A8C9CW42_PHOSS